MHMADASIFVHTTLDGIQPEAFHRRFAIGNLDVEPTALGSRRAGE